MSYAFNEKEVVVLVGESKTRCAVIGFMRNLRCGGMARAYGSFGVLAAEWERLELRVVDVAERPNADGEREVVWEVEEEYWRR